MVGMGWDLGLGVGLGEPENKLELVGERTKNN